MTHAGQHQPAVHQIFAALVVDLHQQLIAFNFKFRAHWKAVDKAHAEKPIIPLA
jgi:hypothetical protein